MRVLLADDDPEMLAQTGNVLAGEFEIVGSATNGMDLIKAVERFDPDVVVLDITMPGLDGIEAARRLKRSGCRTKLVFLTVHEDPDVTPPCNRAARHMSSRRAWRPTSSRPYTRRSPFASSRQRWRGTQRINQ